jgi:choline dehydrogenase-like flavoprotein
MDGNLWRLRALSGPTKDAERMMESFDYVIVGAGSSGCVLANRLSADLSCKVLLIESGPRDTNPFIHMPKGVAKVMANLSILWPYMTKPHETTGGNAEAFLRGKTLGGSSAVNGMMYVRGQDADYDEMAEIAGDDWNWAHIGQSYKELEKHELGAAPTRGDKGWLRLTVPKRAPLMDAAIAAGEKLGLVRKADVNEPDDVERVGYASRTVYQGKRQSAAVAFLKPVMNRPNLTVVTGIVVDKLLLDGTRAIGVTGTKGGAPVSYGATREVILSAGSMGSPAILQRSGIGPADHLRSVGVDVVVDSPNLGKNLREHRAIVMQFRADDKASENSQYSGLKLFRNVLHYYLNKGGVMGNATYEAGAWFKTRPDAPRPDGQFLLAPFTMDFSGPVIATEKHGGFQICAYMLRPRSLGSVMITSPDPTVLPEVIPNYHADPYDRQTMVDVVRYARKYVQQAPLNQLVSEETRPGPQYETDDQIIVAYDQMGNGAYHATGTCAAGLDESAVCDSRLRVRGTQGLRVVDTSVMPFILAGNTNGPAMAVSWRAADLIIADNNSFRA